MSYSHRRGPSAISIDYDSDASTSSRRSLHAKRQYPIYAQPHRRSLSTSLRSPSIHFRNDLYVEEEEVGEEETDHGHPFPQETAPGISASSVMHRISRLFKNHRRAIVFLGLFLLASGSLHFLNQPYVDVTQARHILDDAIKWSGEKVGIKTSSRSSTQPTDCHFRSTVEAYRTALKRLRREQRAFEAGVDPEAFLDEDDADSSDFDHLDLSSSNSGIKSNASHYFSPSGHVVITDREDVEHPIPQLLLLGEKRWEDVLSRQSRTLEEAVVEYRRRYSREPPKGFDLWWEFAMANDVVLPDEYDRIHLDLAPFFALPRDEMHKRVEQVQNLPETYTLRIRRGKVTIDIADKGGLAWEGTWPRAVDSASIIKAFSKHLPDMRAVFSIHDQPQVYVSWARRSSLVDLGLRDTTHLKESDSSEVRWSRSCSPDSNLRKAVPPAEEGSLIYDTAEAMDMCQNPYMLDLHGLTVEKHGPASHPLPHTSLLPLFSLAKTSINSDILITPVDQFTNPIGRDPVWKKKPDSRMIWRGSTTGISWMDQTTPWRKAHRFRLHAFAQNQSEEPLTFYMPDITGEGGALKMRKETGTVKDIAEFFYDMKLAGSPLQCDEGDGTCETMDEEFDFAPHQTPDQLNQYKFMFDIDGNGWSARFRRLMTTNSVVLKTGMFTEWFQAHIVPWFHYVPTRLDYSDLPTILGFLRGSPESPDQGFDEVAQAIAQNGKCFVQKMFRVEDLQAYMFRLLLEYARLVAPTDEGVDFLYEFESDLSEE